MATYKQLETKKTPISQTNVFYWLQKQLFSTLFNSILSIFCLYLLYLVIPPVVNWAIIDANFTLTTNEQCGREGACWSYIFEKLNLFIYGFYPQEQYWRPQLVLFLAVAFVLLASLMRAYEHKLKVILAMFLIYPFCAFILLYGGLGLEVIETHKWGGLMLTLVIATTGIVASFPIGILLALGRQSKLNIIKSFSIIYIEFIRGVPLITILFMASVILPLFFSEGVNIDKLLRALIGITMFQAAYIAEVIRGGIQAIPKGQYEAADAGGLNFYQKTMLIILPQALKISIPNIVGSFIALFKDTTLVLIIGLFDMLAMVGLSTSDENWLGRETEGYVFVAIVIWVILYTMSRYCRALEVRFNTDYK